MTCRGCLNSWIEWKVKWYRIKHVYAKGKHVQNGCTYKEEILQISIWIREFNITFSQTSALHPWGPTPQLGADMALDEIAVQHQPKYI